MQTFHQKNHFIFKKVKKKNRTHLPYLWLLSWLDSLLVPEPIIDECELSECTWCECTEGSKLFGENL